MQLDYFELVMGLKSVMESRLEKARRHLACHQRFLQDGELAGLAATSMHELAMDRPLGDA